MSTRIYAPFGYKLDNEKGYIDAENEEEMRDIAMSMSDDKRFRKHILKENSEGLIKFFKENGFEVKYEK